MTRRHRRHSTAKKREIVEAYLNGEALHALSKEHDVCRNLIRVWIEKYERGEYDDDAVVPTPANSVPQSPWMGMGSFMWGRVVQTTQEHCLHSGHWIQIVGHR